MGIFYSVPQAKVAVVERFGKFHALHNAGLHCLFCCCWFGDNVAGYESLRVQQLNVRVETKTKDNVFVEVGVAVQYHADAERVETAFYRLTDTQNQIRSYVFDVVRAEVPKMNLDDVFEQKNEVASLVQDQLRSTMEDFGYIINAALVTDVKPAQIVKDSMNQINAARRVRMAAEDRGEAEKIIVVKAAEANAEATFLRGQGVARQRKAIVEGLRESVADFAGAVDETEAKEVMDIVLMTQYFDAIAQVSHESGENEMFVGMDPGSLAELAAQMRASFHVDREAALAPMAMDDDMYGFDDDDNDM